MKVTILYGSQMGTAQDLAERMTRQAIQLNLHPHVHSLDDYDLEKLKEEEHLVFIASTTGQGDEPDNMRNFWKFLCRKNCPPIFQGIKYCVMGLGDSSYAKYNFVAKKLQKRIGQLGGISMLPIGLADDQHDLGIDAVIPQWILSVWKAILGIEVENVTGVIGPRFKIEEVLENGSANGNNTAETEGVTSSGVRLNEVVRTQRVTSPDHFQDVRFIEISSAHLNYEPGDVLAVQPRNRNENIDLFFSLFPTLNPSQRLNLVPQYKWISIPPRIRDTIKSFTWANIAEFYLDIQSVPSRSFFEYLKHFSTDELENEKLAEFCTAAGQDDLYKYCFKPKRSILEVLVDFPHTTKLIPVEYIFDLIPHIKPRYFSIAGYSTDCVPILVAVVEYKTLLKKPRLGLCSNWLASLKEGDIVPCWVDKGSFTFPPPDKELPVVMIGPGTGCAPFNSLIFHRIPLNSANQFYLFFGCRYAEKDHFFKKPWSEFKEKGKLNVFIAFSRDPDSKFVYVQHHIKAQGDLLFDLIVNKNAIIYVAGNAKRMPQDVQEEIISVLETRGVNEAEAFVKNLVRIGRYQTEVWA